MERTDPTPTPKESLGTSRPVTVAIVALLVAAHLVVLGSVLRDDRSVIWPLHNDTIHRQGRAADFYAVYHAGVVRSQGLSAYADGPDGRTPYFYPFRYLPIVAEAARGLAVFEPETAYLVWIAVVEATLAVLLVVLWRRSTNAVASLGVTALLLINSPFFLEIHMGQFTFVAIALCCLAFLVARGPVLLSLSVLLKPIGLAVVPSLLRERRRWPYAIVLAIAVVSLNAPYFAVYPNDWQGFFRGNFEIHTGLDSGNFGALYLVFLAATDFNLSLVLIQWVAFASGLRIFVLGATAVIVLLSKSRDTLIAVSALLLAHFVSYQHVWEHHMSAVCVVAAVLASDGNRTRTTQAWILIALVLLALPTPYGFFDIAKDPTVWDPAVDWPRVASYLVVLPKVVPTVALFGYCVATLLRRGVYSFGEVRAKLTAEV